MLLQFFILLTIILVAEIGGAVWVYHNRAELSKYIQEGVRDTVRETVRKDYGKDEVATRTLDLIQQTLKCCGADSYTSWANSAYNGVTSGAQSSPLGGIAGLLPNYQLPKSCCSKPDSDACEATRKTGSLNIVASALTEIVYTEVIFFKFNFFKNNLVFIFYLFLGMHTKIGIAP